MVAKVWKQVQAMYVVVKPALYTAQMVVKDFHSVGTYIKVYYH